MITQKEHGMLHLQEIWYNVHYFVGLLNKTIIWDIKIKCIYIYIYIYNSNPDVYTIYAGKYFLWIERDFVDTILWKETDT